MIAVILLGPALAIALLVAAAVRYRPAPAPAQCLAHEDCPTPHACNTAIAAEFAACGYSDFDRWKGAA